MAEQELKACPFCGGERLVADEYVRGVKCSDCQGQSHLYRWNTRPIENALTARLSSAEAEVERLRAIMLNLVRAMENEIDTRRCRASSLHALNLARKEVNATAARRQQGGTDAR